MTTTPTLTGKDINDAAQATRAVLERVLAEAETTFFTWAVLFTVASHADAIPEDTLVAILTQGTSLDEAAVGSGIAEMEAAGLVRRKPAAADGPVGDRLELTGEGAARYEQLQEAVNDASARLYDGIPWGDLATTRFVLEEVTERANVLVRRAEEATTARRAAAGSSAAGLRSNGPRLDGEAAAEA